MSIRLLFSSPELFAKNVQLRLAEALSLPSTDITFTKYYNDYCAQHNLIDNNKATTSSGSSNHHHSHPSQSGDSHSDPSQKKVLWTTSLSTFIYLMKEKIKSSIGASELGAQKLGAHFGLQNVKASAFYHLNDQFKRRQNLFREFHLLLSLLPCPKAP